MKPVFILTLSLLSLLAACETTTTYHPDGTRVETRRLMPEAIEAVQIHYLVNPQK